MGELSGKVAIVTGASKGIGAAIARRFAEAGAAVAVNYASDKAGADRVVEEIVRKGGKAVAIQASVSKGADVKRLFAETKAKLGAPSILVNNAGVFSFAPIEAVTEEDVERQFGTNVLGTLLASKEAVAAFDGAGGSIINLSTIASVNPVPNSVVYSSSKAAVDTITRALALELAPKNIRVNAIAPGATETEGTKTMGLTMETAKAMGMVMPMGRIGQPDDIARVAVFLASDQSSWLTGRTHLRVRRTALTGHGLRNKRRSCASRSGVCSRSLPGPVLQSADGRISPVEVVVQTTCWVRLGPTAARRHRNRRRHCAEQRTDDGNSAIAPPAPVVRIADITDSRRVPLLLSSDRIVAIIIAERRESWRRDERQRNRCRK